MAMLVDGLILIAILFVFLAAGLWVGGALLFVGVIGLWLAGAPAGDVIATQIWGSSTAWSLTPLPLFIWMGEIMLRADLAGDLFRGLAPLFRRVPGRLAHVNIASASLFSAVCGSSTATAAIMGRMSIGELTALGYDRRPVLASVAAAGTLGIMIPPSIAFIVYGAAADVSIIHLFLAGVIPGLALALMFSGYIVADSFMRPQLYGKGEGGHVGVGPVASILGVLPIVAMILGMIAVIYSGVATATEVGAVGVVFSLGMAAWRGKLTGAMLAVSIRETVKTNSMIFFLLACAGTLSMAMGFSGLPNALAEMVRDMGLSAYALIFVLAIGLLVLGCFLDGLSITVLTSAVVLPMVQAVGIDLIWFGVFLVVLCEIGLITPPVGFNLFVVSSISGVDMMTIAKAVLPYVVIMLLFVVVLTVFPQIALFLPQGS